MVDKETKKFPVTLSENFGYPRPAPKPSQKKKGRKPKAAENSETNSGE